MERRVALILNLIFLGVSTAFIGPFYTDQNLVVMCIALVVAGFLLGPIMIMPMQEMMESTRIAYPDCDLEHATNLLSGILNSSIGVGQAIGPIFGSTIYQIVGFRATQDATALVVITSGVLYLLFGQGFQAFAKTCSNFSKRNDVPSAETDLVNEIRKVKYSGVFKSTVVSHQSKASLYQSLFSQADARSKRTEGIRTEKTETQSEHLDQSKKEEDFISVVDSKNEGNSEN